ncbi:hypothetical protein BLNAU_15141 [Blattamonas nauphoetae]|uniref:Uncharacterized protein n=1 Tax=Blattamonas nauphoetae TaxID=2049346 RepID=A0ABQ9XBK9_9EUKA|nr:hypothetical protein BLNAU_15141 [Blattamonas nauphoetae]
MVNERSLLSLSANNQWQRSMLMVSPIHLLQTDFQSQLVLLLSNEHFVEMMGMTMTMLTTMVCFHKTMMKQRSVIHSSCSQVLVTDERSSKMSDSFRCSSVAELHSTTRKSSHQKQSRSYRLSSKMVLVHRSIHLSQSECCQLPTQTRTKQTTIQSQHPHLEAQTILPTSKSVLHSRSLSRTTGSSVSARCCRQARTGHAFLTQSQFLMTASFDSKCEVSVHRSQVSKQSTNHHPFLCKVDPSLHTEEERTSMTNQQRSQFGLVSLSSRMKLYRKQPCLTHLSSDATMSLCMSSRSQDMTQIQSVAL